MNAIIVAAGPGSRLKHLTRDRPKCLLDVGGKTIIERALEALRANGIDDIAVVRGWQSHLIDFPGLTYYHNPDFLNNNILTSLFYAEDAMTDAFVFSYSDILYTPEIISQLLRCDADVAIVVDVDWQPRYRARDQHPISEAELVTAKDGRVEAIGKRVVAPEQAHGEFIGLASFSRAGVELLRAAYHRVAVESPDGPFHQAASLKKAYLTDMVQELVDGGAVVRNVDIRGGWNEIDTAQDLAEARRHFASGA